MSYIIAPSIFFYLSNFASGIALAITSKFFKNESDEAHGQFASDFTRSLMMVWWIWVFCLWWGPQFLMRPKSSLVSVVPARLRSIAYWFLVIRSVILLAWVCALSVIKPCKSQVFAAIAYLVDLLWSCITYMYFTAHEDDYTDRPSENLFSPELDPADCIFRSVAESIVDARRQQYGPDLQRFMGIENKTSDPMVQSDGTYSKFIYTPRESLAEGHQLLSAMPKQTVEEQQEEKLFPGFLRCGCCLDASVAKFPNSTEHDLESPHFSDWDHERNEFLRNVPIGPIYKFSPGEKLPYNAHHLCSTCKLTCSQISWRSMAASGKTEERKKRLYPKQLYLSLKHYDTPALLRDSSRICHLCALFWGCLNIDQQNALLRGDQTLSEKIQSNDPEAAQKIDSRRFIRIVVIDDVIVPHFGGFKRPRRWEPFIRGYKNLRMDIGGEFANPVSIMSPTAAYSSAPVVLPCSDNTGSEAAVDLIKNVLLEHEPVSTSLPSRLIDVRKISSGLIRLRSFKQLSTPGKIRYTALSHCWGTLIIPTLQLSNIKKFESGYDFTQLPKTFREAMSLTSLLNIDYIWIDSLCIIQDSPLDWEHEAALMADIYRGATCTITANASWDASEGLFRPQFPFKSSPCLLTHVSGIPVYAVPRAHSEASTLQADLMLSKWNSRGWCLQERYLSSAMIYFSERQIYFALGNQLSLGKDADKFYLKGQLDTDEIWGNAAKEKDQRSFVRQRLGKKTRDGWHSTWWAIVNDYTTRDLTKPSDKLAAISGLAVFIHDQIPLSCEPRPRERPSEQSDIIHRGNQVLNQQYQDSSSIYLAGLWKVELISGLLWFVDLRSDKERPKVFRAPSWSWGSVDGVISNDSLHLDTSEAGVEIIEYCSKSTIQQAVQIRHPWLVDNVTSLRLQGQLSKARWTATSSEDQKRYYVMHRLKSGPLRDIKDDSKLRQQFSCVCNTPGVGPLCHELLHPNTLKRIGWFLPDTSEPLPEVVYCLKFQIRFRGSAHVARSHSEFRMSTDDSRPPHILRGLVLTPHSDSGQVQPSAQAKKPLERNIYRRLGYFELDCSVKGRTESEITRYVTVIGPRGERRREPYKNEFLVANFDIDPSNFFGNTEPTVFTLV